ncbi:MAG: hypothetical protein HDQ88_12050 [Clostridia bacterium]|nr:hypothetical protein [Clostridia bacterium]
MKGRYDIVVFPNGGWECIGRIANMPEHSEQELYEHAKAFAESKSVDVPTKFTGEYAPDEPLAIIWGEWKEPIPEGEGELFE